MKMLLGTVGAVFIWVMAGAGVPTISAQSPAEGNLTDYSDLELFPDGNETISQGLL